MNSSVCSRRTFCINAAKVVVSAGIAQYAFTSCANKNSISPDTVTVTVDITLPPNTPLQNAGGSVYVENPVAAGYPIIVYRKSASEVTAFSSRCTHQGGTVAPVEGGFAVCTLHGSVFDGEGTVVSGQAIKNLVTYAATINGTIITIAVSGF